MKLITLVENSAGRAGCIDEHGLSIYIETDHHKILMDTGASDAFLKNAQLLGIDLSQVDLLVLSHGHYDHAGGILEFAKINTKASICMRPTAGGEYYNLKSSGPKYIGMDSKICELAQIKYTGELERLDDEITMFSGVSGRKLWPKGNESLKVLVEGEYRQDIFDHEQYLVVQEKGMCILISGCAHNGILNILDKYREIYGGAPDVVISGFHMKKNLPLNEEEKDVVRNTARALADMKNTIFYTGHCTGEEAFDIMKESMGEQLKALHSGEQIMNDKEVREQDIDAIIALLDGYVASEGSRMKIQVTEGEGKVLDKKYHHGRCDVGSPWAKGAAFDLCE